MQDGWTICSKTGDVAIRLASPKLYFSMSFELKKAIIIII